jgi:acetyl-CoA acetyltransferase family protein
VDLSALVLNAVVSRNGIQPTDVEDVYWGCVTQIGDQSGNVARFAILAAGWPDSIAGVTVNRACGSSQQAIDFAAMAILSGHADIVIAGGVESMSRTPLGASRATGFPYGPGMTNRYAGQSFNQGLGAEEVARRWGLSRSDLDGFAARSHRLAAAAEDSGYWESQIVPVETESGLLATDQGIRRGTSVETLAGLKPAFLDEGVIHAGNASQISDGASALLMMSSDRAASLGLKPLARWVASTAVGDDPVMMLTAPIPATRKLLTKLGMKIGDIGTYEVNEAFAPVPLAWLVDVEADEKRLNPEGGAIALGHPLGASGALLMTRMIYHMRANDILLGLQTMCEAGGTANATIVELI